ncbi:MAG: Nif3-like dinuclear metal center hexameric protein [Gammaproteobacteria bacterium]|nr:Nif3-like dinuclear metal center hexameric protein [Gammaproteobacteria bacterium]
MAISMVEMQSALNELLRPNEFRDYCPNGLQVEGKAQIANLVTGVTASLALIEEAVEKGADAILVHHGYFWKGEDPTVTGIRKNRLKLLLDNDINLFGFHLPLDAHPKLGNNAQLGLKLGFSTEADLDPQHKSRVGVWGSLEEPCNGKELVERITNQLNRAPFHIQGEKETIEKIGWCTGSAQSYIELAYEAGVDAYLTGEVSEQTVHFARETGMHFFAAGHHATERYGVQAVGQYLAGEFGLNHEFIDIDNPV